MLRKLREFEYIEPASLSEAVSLLDRYREQFSRFLGDHLGLAEAADSGTVLLKISYLISTYSAESGSCGNM